MENLCYATDDERDTCYAILKTCDLRKKQQECEAKNKRDIQQKLLEEIKDREKAQKHITFNKNSSELTEKIQNIKLVVDETKQFIDDNEKLIIPYKKKLHDERVNLYKTQISLREMCYDHKLVPTGNKYFACDVCGLDLR